MSYIYVKQHCVRFIVANYYANRKASTVRNPQNMDLNSWESLIVGQHPHSDVRGKQRTIVVHTHSSSSAWKPFTPTMQYKYSIDQVRCPFTALWDAEDGPQYCVIFQAWEFAERTQIVPIQAYTFRNCPSLHSIILNISTMRLASTPQ